MIIKSINVGEIWLLIKLQILAQNLYPSYRIVSKSYIISYTELFQYNEGKLFHLHSFKNTFGQSWRISQSEEFIPSWNSIFMLLITELLFQINSNEIIITNGERFLKVIILSNEFYIKVITTNRLGDIHKTLYLVRYESKWIQD
jgi:hypothetical protein